MNGGGRTRTRRPERIILMLSGRCARMQPYATEVVTEARLAKRRAAFRAVRIDTGQLAWNLVFSRVHLLSLPKVLPPGQRPCGRSALPGYLRFPVESAYRQSPSIDMIRAGRAAADGGSQIAPVTPFCTEHYLRLAAARSERFPTRSKSTGARQPHFINSFGTPWNSRGCLPVILAV